MNPTTFNNLKKITNVTCLSRGLTITTQSSWVVDGEDRLSYTTLTRLVECCREYHWQTDIMSICNSNKLDSICKSYSAEFLQPVAVNREILIIYQVTNIRSKGYGLKFEIQEARGQTTCAEFNMISIFYDSIANQAISPPETVVEKLKKMIGSNCF